MSILDRHVGREMLLPLCFGVCAFTSLFISSDLLRLAGLVVEQGAPIEAAVKAFAYGIPQILVWTLPMSVLLATLLSLSKLSAGSELVAIQAAGRSFIRIVTPVLVAGFVVSLVALGIGELVVPRANEAARRVLIEEVEGRRLPTVQRDVLLRGPGGEWFLYAQRFDGRRQVFEGMTMVRLDGGEPVETTHARRVVWEADAWYMEDGQTFLLGDGSLVRAAFGSSRQRLELDSDPDEIALRTKAPEEMSLAELGEHIAVLRAQGAEVRELEVQMHLKYALPFASLVFALIGAPLGVQPHRSASSLGFGLSIILIFVYYVLMSLGSALGQAGVLPPVLAAWMQNLLVGGVGVGLVWRQQR